MPTLSASRKPRRRSHQLTDDVFSPAGYHCFYEDAEKKGYSGTAIYTKHEPKKVVRGYGDAEFDAEGRYLEVQLGRHQCRVPVSAFRLVEGRAADCQVSLHGFLHRAPQDAQAPPLANMSSAATGTSCTRKSISRTGSRIRRTPVSCPKSARGWTRCSVSTARSTHSGRSSRSPSSTRGGRIVAAPGITMSGGGSTTTSSRRGWQTRFAAPRSTGTSAFPIMPR